MDASFNIEPSHHLTLLTHSTISFGVYNLTGRKNAYSVYYISENGKLKGYKMAIFGVDVYKRQALHCWIRTVLFTAVRSRWKWKPT